MANTVLSAMTPLQGPIRSLGSAVEQAGRNMANAIDLTSLDDSDDEIPTNNGSASKTNEQSRASLSRSSQTPEASPQTPKIKVEPNQETSSDDNDLDLVLRRGRRRPDDIYRVAKRKWPPGNDSPTSVKKRASPTKILDKTTLNTSILLNVDEEELMGTEPHPALFVHHPSAFELPPKAHGRVPNPRTSAHAKRPPAKRSLGKPTTNGQAFQQSVSSKTTAQNSLNKSATSANAVNSDHQVTKTPLGKQISNTQAANKTQQADFDLFGDGDSDDNDYLFSSPVANGERSRPEQSLFKTQEPLAPEASNPQDKQATRPKRAPTVDKDEFNDAAAQMRRLQAQHERQQHKTKLVDPKTVQRRAVPNSVTLVNEPPQSSRPSRSSRPHKSAHTSQSQRKSRLPKDLRLSHRPRGPTYARQHQQNRFAQVPQPPRDAPQPQRDVPQPPQHAPRPARDDFQPLPDRQPSQQMHRATAPSQPRPRPAARTARINNDEFQDAAALMRNLQAQHSQREPPKRATFVDRLPDQPVQNSPARRVSNPNKNLQNLTFTSDYRIRKRRSEIKHDINRRYPNESEEEKARLIEQKLNEYLINRRRREAMQEHRRYENHFADAIEEAESESEEEEELNARGGMPLIQALESTGSRSVILYAVFASEPHDDCSEHSECLQRRQAFPELKSANAYAEALLRGQPNTPKRKKGEPKRSKRDPPRLSIESYQEKYKDGMLSGLLSLTTGKIIVCEVRKEVQAVGDLDPNSLRRRWAKKEFVEVFCLRRYDVFLIKVVPTTFKERDERDEAEQKRQKEKEEKEKEKRMEREKQNEENAVGLEAEEAQQGENGEDGAVDEPKITTALEGDNLRAALANLSTFNNNIVSENSNEEDDEMQEGDDSNYDAASEAGSDVSMSSTSTVQEARPPSPPPNSRGGHLAYNSNSHHGPNPWFQVEHQHIHCCTYTDLRMANDTAFRIAKEKWKPRTPNLDAWAHYETSVLQAIEREREVTDMDHDRADIVFPVHPWHGHDDHRPWGFVQSYVKVEETVLEGPRDIGAAFVWQQEVEAGIEVEAEGPREEQEQAQQEDQAQEAPQEAPQDQAHDQAYEPENEPADEPAQEPEQEGTAGSMETPAQDLSIPKHVENEETVDLFGADDDDRQEDIANPSLPADNTIAQDPSIEDKEIIDLFGADDDDGQQGMPDPALPAAAAAAADNRTTTTTAQQDDSSSFLNDSGYFDGNSQAEEKQAEWDEEVISEEE